MSRYNYQVKNGRSVWVCEACKKANMDLILLGVWKLIDRRDDSSACEQCVQVPDAHNGPSLEIQERSS